MRTRVQGRAATVDALPVSCAAERSDIARLDARRMLRGRHLVEPYTRMRMLAALQAILREKWWCWVMVGGQSSAD